MKVVYIAHPIGGDVHGNLDKVVAIVRWINLNEEDVIPFAPYVADLLALRDAEAGERRRGMENNKHYFRCGFIDELWLFGDTISEGMREEIEMAKEMRIKIVAATAATKKLFNAG